MTMNTCAQYKTVILSVCGTSQLLQALCAAKYKESLLSKSIKYRYILLVTDLHFSYNQEKEFADSILKLSQFWNWDKKILLYPKTLNKIIGSLTSLKKKSENLKKLIGVSSIDEIYLVEKNFSEANNLLVYTYPAAHQIFYGDTYGTVQDPKSDFLKQIFPWKQTLKRRVYTRIIELVKYTFKQKIPISKFDEFDEAVLTLPIDCSGTYLPKIKHSFVPLSILKNIMFLASHSIKQEVDAYLDHNNLTDGKIDLLLLTTLLLGHKKADELAIKQQVISYVKLVQQYCPKGGKVIIKPHPRLSTKANQLLVKELRDQYQVVLLEDVISRYPVELLIGFLNVKTVISFMSSSALGIALFSDAYQVINHAPEVYSGWLNERELNYVLFYQKVISESVEKINNGWNGGEVLWSKN